MIPQSVSNSWQEKNFGLNEESIKTSNQLAKHDCTPPCHYLPTGPVPLTTMTITHTLQVTTTFLGPQGLLPSDISDQSLHASSAMTLCACIDGNIFQLLGHWRSDSMLHFLHIQAKPIIMWTLLPTCSSMVLTIYTHTRGSHSAKSHSPHTPSALLPHSLLLFHFPTHTMCHGSAGCTWASAEVNCDPCKPPVTFSLYKYLQDYHWLRHQ